MSALRRGLLMAGLLAAMVGCGGMQTAFAQTSCVQQSQVSLTGTLRAANGLPSANDIITLTPSQVGIVGGCGVNVAVATTCSTSTDGSVVQTPNPRVGPALSTTTGGTLPSGTYYVVFAWYDALGHITLASPEVVQQLSVQGTLVVTPPAAIGPATAVGMQVYIGTAAGTETLQGVTHSLAGIYTQGAPLVNGMSLPTANNTVCVATANDSIWPVGTGYVVSMVDSSGNALPGYPMQWQLTGAGTTINLSNGLPYYHGVVFYPTPVLTSPPAHATQSISGSVSLTGYNLLSVGKIGVGTGLPAWPIDVENGAVNASGGYIYNGGTGVTAGECLQAGTDAYHAFVPANCAGGVQTVQANGTALPVEGALNVLTPLTAVDNATNHSTDVGLGASGVTPGTYAAATVTVDTYGRVTSAAASGYNTTVRVDKTTTAAFGTVYTNSSAFKLTVQATCFVPGGVGQFATMHGLTGPPGSLVELMDSTMGNGGGAIGIILFVLPGQSYEITETHTNNACGLTRWTEDTN